MPGQHVAGCYVPHGAGSSALIGGKGDHGALAAAARCGAPPLADGEGAAARYSAIVVVSAHWHGRGTFLVTSAQRPGYEHDYAGLIDGAPLTGDPALAHVIQSEFGAAGIPCTADARARLDDVVAGPLAVMYPDVAAGTPTDAGASAAACNIPVLSLSLHSSLDPVLHERAGAALHRVSAARSKPVLFIGSGMTLHNFSLFGAKLGAGPQRQCQEFSDAVNGAVAGAAGSAAARALHAWQGFPHARFVHKHGDGDHFLPLVVVAAACGEAVGEPLRVEAGQGGPAMKFYKWAASPGRC